MQNNFNLIRIINIADFLLIFQNKMIKSIDFKF